MQNLKIQVSSEAESKEAQELFFKLGYEWLGSNRKYVCGRIGLIFTTVVYGRNIISLNEGNTYHFPNHKEITLPELRAMVNQDQDEPFLTPETTLNDQYAKIEEVRQALRDNVNNPSHYADSAIECIDAMEAMMTPEQFIGYLRGNLFKYQWRYEKKNGIEDLKKAQWYLEKLTAKVAEKNAPF